MSIFGKLSGSGVIKNFSNNTKGVALEGLGLSVILAMICMLLLVNIVRVINNGRENYQVYLYERNLLEEIKQNNTELAEEYELVTSLEGKKMLARSVLHLVDASEDIYDTKKQAEFFRIEKELLDLSVKKEYQDWWEIII